MNYTDINKNLSCGVLDKTEMFPHLSRLLNSSYIFQMDFGLPELPSQPGILIIRGARQYGKSTWLEQEIVKTIEKFGEGTAFYLNGDDILDPRVLEKELEALVVSFAKNASVKRIFIDEITSVPNWELVLKKMADKGKLAEILIITTGSKATDLRRGAEKLPGRKGKLSRTSYLFTPVAYREFHRVCHQSLGNETLIAYLLSGGSPIACNELATFGTIPEYVIELVRDWVEGEVTKSGRSRTSLFNIINALFRFGGTALGQAKLAREAGLANNTVAHNYVEILSDLCCVTPAYQWDQHKKMLILRKECKYHFTNLLVAVAYHPARVRSPKDFLQLSEVEQGMWHEWLVAQELLRRTAITGDELLAPLKFWQNKNHEIDFVAANENFIEVKRGNCDALEFSWFPKQFPSQQLTVINQKEFATAWVRGQSLEEFLIDG
ncbi:MAG: AAA family ATPase [Gammaproteobacteria bacterium]|nr:AAA family ATPase [Gammaproteobacteria bacterium]